MRIKDVMKDKYRLTDKFVLIASFLSNEIEEDIESFKSMKKLRDDIFHGKEFNEETLPVEDAAGIFHSPVNGFRLNIGQLGKWIGGNVRFEKVKRTCGNAVIMEALFPVLWIDPGGYRDT